MDWLATLTPIPEQLALVDTSISSGTISSTRDSSAGSTLEGGGVSSTTAATTFVVVGLGVASSANEPNLTDEGVPVVLDLK